MPDCKDCIYLGEMSVCNRCAGPNGHAPSIGVVSLWEGRAQNGELVEHDPNGIPANTAGAKLDPGENCLGLVLGCFSRALHEVGQGGTFGANKYTDNGWVEVPDGKRRYTDAMLRHILKEAAGEEVDVDSGLLHAAHAAWNALARLDLMLRQGE